jgi:hypothetical protein
MNEPLPLSDQDKADLEELAADPGVQVEDLPPLDLKGAARNKPCPCGSGKKYKACHGAVPESDPVEENPAPFYPILKVWQKILESAPKVEAEGITFRWATGICAQYQQMTFERMPEFARRYYAKLEEMRELLQLEVDSDDECFSPVDAEEDVKINGSKYKSLVIGWQVRLVEWERAWDCLHPNAPEECAASSEVYKFFFADEQLVSHLTRIGFKFTESDQEDLMTALAEAEHFPLLVADLPEEG